MQKTSDYSWLIHFKLDKSSEDKIVTAGSFMNACNYDFMRSIIMSFFPSLELDSIVYLGPYNNKICIMNDIDLQSVWKDVNGHQLDIIVHLSSLKRKVEDIWLSPTKRTKIDHVTKLVGAHTFGGIREVVHMAASIGAKSFAFDLPDRLSQGDIELFKQQCEEFGYNGRVIMPHSKMITNFGSFKDSIYKYSRHLMKIEMKMCDQLGIKLYNFHPGSTVKLGTIEDCIKRISNTINDVHRDNPDSVVISVIENMSKGKATTVGNTFEQLKNVIDGVENKSRVGVCLDTCHLYSAGYDIKSSISDVLDKFDKIVGLSYLKAMHLNDSKTEFNSMKDKHANIGTGTIGLDCFRDIMIEPRLEGIPMILETPFPNGIPKYEEEIETLLSLTS